MVSSLLSTTINEDIRIDDGTLVIRDTRLEQFVIERQFPSGANGVAFAARHALLGSPRAVKIWMANRSNDDRDKLRQGVAEARAMAAAHPEWVASIHEADEAHGYFWGAMELLNGETLKSYLKHAHTKQHLWMIARLYINGITAVTTSDSFHGDPHGGNVIVYDYERGPKDSGKRLKFIDFGTSKVGKGITRKRHWRIVNETFRKILDSFDSFKDFAASIDALHAQLRQGDHYPSPHELDDLQLFQIARYDDILDGLKLEAGLLPRPVRNEVSGGPETR